MPSVVAPLNGSREGASQHRSATTDRYGLFTGDGRRRRQLAGHDARCERGCSFILFFFFFDQKIKCPRYTDLLLTRTLPNRSLQSHPGWRLSVFKCFKVSYALQRQNKFVLSFFF